VEDVSTQKADDRRRATLLWFGLWLAVAVILTLVSIYFYNYQVPKAISIAPGGDATDSQLRYLAWYGIIAAATISAIAAAISLARYVRRR
jgi:hypothetical protein